jgi:hypothetical protein
VALLTLSCGATAAASLVADLSRESWRLRRRASQVQAALTRCRHRGLQQRLRSELEGLLQRRQRLGQLCSELQAPAQRGDSLPLALLAELCRRPLLPI